MERLRFFYPVGKAPKLCDTEFRTSEGWGRMADRQLLRLFAESYGLPEADKKALPAMMTERLRSLIAYMEAEAAAGNGGHAETSRRGMPPCIGRI